MVLFYSDINKSSDNLDSDINENSSFLPSSNIYERVRSETPVNQGYNYNKIVNRLDRLEKLITKIYTSNGDKKDLRSSATSFLSDFSLDGVENMFENNSTHKLMFYFTKKTFYLFYILIALAFILYKLYKVNLEI